jgi:sialic acid synthase SpsE
MVLKKNKHNFKIIAEIGSNWNGDVRVGKKIIRELKKSGVDAVKFQMWKANELYDSSHPNWNEIKKSELTCKHAKEFKKYSDKIGIDCFWSVFYPEAVDFLEKIGVKYYKIASRTSALLDKNSEDTMIAIAKTKKPVIISMGFGGNKTKIKNIFKNNKKYWLYCISEYPTDIKKIDFKLIQKYDGFSDHTEDNLAPLTYAIKSKHQKKVKFLEKHVHIAESTGPDKPFSISNESFAKMVKDIKTVLELKI